MLLEDFLNYFRSVKNRSLRTCKEYKKCIDQMHVYIRTNRHDEEDELSFYRAVTKHDMIAYITFCDSVLKNDAQGRCLKISAARAFYQYLFEHDYISQNVMMAVPRPQRKVKPVKCMSLVDSVVLLQSATKHPIEFYRLRNTCMLTIFLNCAFRLSELANIKLKDVTNDAITVLGKGNKVRTVHINPAVRDTLNKYLQIRPSGDEMLFVDQYGKSITSGTIASIVKENIKRAGLNPTLSTHKLRHTSATLMHKYGNADIRVLQSVLGHASIATTERYLHVDTVQSINAVNGNPLASLIL